ncbi:MAG: hypothetical protein J0L92_23485 [Deltaproteobacteria bacterium]|nr:hypothetical protein [Deltaproteobacteria bacterium]
MSIGPPSAVARLEAGDSFSLSQYYGDRAVKSVTVDGWRAAVRVTVDVLSRIRSSDGQWNDYADEDIDDADLVFTGVREVVWTPAGPIPNDLLNHMVAGRRSRNRRDLGDGQEMDRRPRPFDVTSGASPTGHAVKESAPRADHRAQLIARRLGR